MKKSLRLCAVCLTLMLLQGCASPRALPQDSATLPPYEVSFTAPVGQVDEQRTAQIQLFLPSLDGTYLVSVSQKASLSPFDWHADALLSLLFAYEGPEAQPLPKADSLVLKNPVEISCGVATVDLKPQALKLSHEELYTVFRAIANTLCQCDGISSVNLLIDGTQPGLSDSGYTPMGALTMHPADDLGALWSRAITPVTAQDGTQKLTQDVSLYFPAKGGKGVLCESRILTFSHIALPHMARTLLDALSDGPRLLEGTADYPALHSYLTTEPEIRETDGQKVLSLRFSQDLNAALLENGITRSCMAASLVYTMTTYLPGIRGVEILIGDELLTSLTPEGTYRGAGERIYFTNGIMEREKFGHFLLSQATLYFAKNDQLVPVRRSLPYDVCCSADVLLQALMQGPDFYDTGDRDLKAVMAPGCGAGDILGTGYAPGNVVLINLTDRFMDLCSGMNETQERLMVYAMVNTLTEIESMHEVCFFADSVQVPVFASHISMSGTFLRNTDIIAR